MMKSLVVIILVFLAVSVLVYADETQDFPIHIELRDDKIIITHKNSIYTFPSKEENKFSGIRKVLQEDVDGDGLKEYIIGTQLREGNADVPYSCVLIGKPNRQKLDIQKQIVVGDYFGDVQLFDVNKDGVKDVVITGTSGMHWSDLVIIGWQNGKYETLWNTGSPSGVFFETDKDGNAQVRIGIPLTENQGWSYADEPDWEIWRWNGNEFVYQQGNTKESRISKLKAR